MTTVNPNININVNVPSPPMSSPPTPRTIEYQEMGRVAKIVLFLKQFNLQDDNHREVLDKLTGAGAGWLVGWRRSLEFPTNT